MEKGTNWCVFGGYSCRETGGKDVMEPGKEIEMLKARIRELEMAVGIANDYQSNIFRLPTSLRRLLGMLMASEFVTPDMINGDLEIQSDAKVAIHRLRRLLKPWNIEINSRRFVGYWIDEETKERVKDLVTQRVTENSEEDTSKTPENVEDVEAA